MNTRRIPGWLGLALTIGLTGCVENPEAVTSVLDAVGAAAGALRDAVADPNAAAETGAGVENAPPIDTNAPGGADASDGAPVETDAADTAPGDSDDTPAVNDDEGGLADQTPPAEPEATEPDEDPTDPSTAAFWDELLRGGRVHHIASSATSGSNFAREYIIDLCSNGEFSSFFDSQISGEGLGIGQNFKASGTWSIVRTDGAVVLNLQIERFEGESLQDDGDGGQPEPLDAPDVMEHQLTIDDEGTKFLTFDGARFRFFAVENRICP